MAKGVISMGITCPIIREGDNLIDIVTNAVLENTWNGHENKYDLDDKDVIGITESVIARAAGLYVTVDDIAEDIKNKFGEKPTIVIDKPIYSRNRFAMILKGIARAAKQVIIYMPDFDEVGNPSGTNPFTGVNIKEYYKQIVENENTKCVIHNFSMEKAVDVYNGLYPVIYCGLHDYQQWKENVKDKHNFITLADICADKNPDFGLLGTNKATEEKLKLFPTKAEATRVCEGVKNKIKEITGKNVIVMSYGDGCFHSPGIAGIEGSSINEFADPVTCPGSSDEELLNSTPNELKIKFLADNKYNNLSGKELDEAIQKEIEIYKGKNLKGSMTSEGTTPRRYADLLASLFDLTTGSGMRATPITIAKHYFN